ncbi:MAG: T9SS type A sorting domain-containing protein [Bacteroidia bacterium]
MCVLSLATFAQGLINNGANIVLTNGSNVYIEGSTGNYTSQMNGVITNYSSGGIIKIEGNWINNSVNTGFTNTGATVLLNGTNQSIGGTNATNFYNLTGSGLGTSPMSSDLLIINTLNLTSGQILDINGKTLTLAGSITGSGVFKGSLISNLIINGSGSAGTINFDQTSAATRTLNSFTLNRNSVTVTLGNALEITGTLNLNNGTLASGGNLKLVSNAGGTAQIAAITGTGSITGNVIAERYVPSTARRWRFISPTISNTSLEDWRGEFFVTGAGTGTTLGTTNSNGFDATGTNSPSVYYYNETAGGNLNNGWTAAPNTGMTLTPGLGYRVFIRGDRSSLLRLTGVDNSQNAVTSNLTGTVNSGDITMPVTYTNYSLSNDDGWNMLGNPYPARYDWYTFWNSGNSGYNGTYYSKIDPNIYVFDATSNSYKSFNALANSGTMNGIIAAGQAFFVKATGPGPSITFKEQFKTSGAPTQMFKTNMDEMRIQMKLDSINMDEFVLNYNPSGTALNDIYDTKKWLNPTVNISSYGTDSVLNALDSRPLLTTNDTLRLNTTGSNGTFTLNFTTLPKNGKYYFLRDNYLSNTVPLSRGTTYSFTISSTTPATQGYSRFLIINSNSSSLPVTFGEFSAVKIGKQVQLKWNVFSEINNSRFEIERSDNAIDFSSIGMIKSKGNSNILSNYNFTDENPNRSTANYYRIKQIDANEKFTYSAIRMIEFGNTKLNLSNGLVRVYPNPAKDLVSISSDAITKGECVISIYSMEGSCVRKWNSSNVSGEINLNISGLDGGLYTLRITDSNGILFTQKMRIE